MVRAICKRTFDVHCNFEKGLKPFTCPTLLLRFETLQRATDMTIYQNPC